MKHKGKGKKKGGDLQDGRGVRCGDYLPPHKYIRNISTCGTTPTEHLLNTGRRPQTSQKIYIFFSFISYCEYVYASLYDFVCIALLLPFLLRFCLSSFFLVYFLELSIIMMLWPGVRSVPLRWESRVRGPAHQKDKIQPHPSEHRH